MLGENQRAERGDPDPRVHELIMRLRTACEECGARAAWLRPSLDEVRGDLERLVASAPPPAFQMRCAVARAQMVLGVWYSVATSATEGDER